MVKDMDFFNNDKKVFEYYGSDLEDFLNNLDAEELVYLLRDIERASTRDLEDERELMYRTALSRAGLRINPELASESFKPFLESAENIRHFINDKFVDRLMSVSPKTIASILKSPSL